MARPEPGAVVAVEVLVEEQVVLPRRVVLEPLDPAEARPPAVVARHEERDQPVAEVGADLVEGELPPRAGRVLELEVVAEEARVAVERLHDEEVDRHPDRPPPVRVPAEHAGRRLGGLVVDRGVHALDVEDERIGLVEARDRPEPVGGEERLLVEEAGEEPENSRHSDDPEEDLAVLGATFRRVGGPEHGRRRACSPSPPGRRRSRRSRRRRAAAASRRSNGP